MKILHLSDLHIGKNIGNYSLLEDQSYILNQIVSVIKRKNVDLVIIAGDIFDNSNPSADAMKVYNSFIEKIIFDLKKIVIAIAGNHDSGKRLSIDKNFYEKNCYYLIGEYENRVISLDDKYGKINFYPIPYLSLAKAKNLFEKDFKNFTEVYEFLLKDIDYSDRNVLITHCYASESTLEDEKIEGEKPLIIGGNDAMDAKLFLNFDYAALGHLHRKHYVLDKKIRYPGTFMKYTFQELDNKSLTLVDLTDEVQIEEAEINPLRDFKTITGYFEDIVKMEKSDDYIQFILKDNVAIENAMAILKNNFPNAVNISYEKSMIFDEEDEFDLDVKNLTSLELFEKFYSYKMGEEVSNDEEEILKRLINETN